VAGGGGEPRGLFVSATDTGAGKTVLAAAICAALRARGERVAAFKPVVTGTDEPADPDWPPDDALLAAASGGRAQDVTPARFGPAVSPHLAAALAGAPLQPAALRAAFAARAASADVVVAEGVGGLLVPLTPDYLVRDLARDLGLPLVLAARPGLGTINHTLLSLEAARAVGLDVRAVVLTPWPAEPSAMEDDNRATIARLGAIEVATLPVLPRADPALLAQAGATLPLDRWLAGLCE
jgi:dethiobiotin synthetase